jgi:hypothetical protein
VSTRSLVVGALYAAGVGSFLVMIAVRYPPLWFLGLGLMLTAVTVYGRGEHLNAREVDRLRRTGWRLQDDIKRLERELGIEESA